MEPERFIEAWNRPASSWTAAAVKRRHDAHATVNAIGESAFRKVQASETMERQTFDHSKSTLDARNAPRLILALQVVLPNPQHEPAAFAQRQADIVVTFPVPQHLRIPVTAMRRWTPIAASAAMPEAAVHEYDEPLALKNEVRLADQVLFAPPASDSVRTQKSD